MFYLNHSTFQKLSGRHLTIELTKQRNSLKVNKVCVLPTKSGYLIQARQFHKYICDKSKLNLKRLRKLFRLKSQMLDP